MASSSRSGGSVAEDNSRALPEATSTVPDSSEVDETEDLCCMCHNGGSLISCDGPCRRAFHANTDEMGVLDNCNTLDISDEEFEFYCNSSDSFFCNNCRYGKMQCHRCKGLGSWNTSDKGRKECKPQEVFRCVVPGCNKFYHRRCSPARCRRHKCAACDVETKDESNPLVPCRLCDTAWHKECLDPDINFDEDSKNQRGWKIMDQDDKKILHMFIFCRDHQAKSSTAKFNPSDLIVFPPEHPREKAARRLRIREKVWECAVCGKVGSLTLQNESQDSVLAVCNICQGEYLVKTSECDQGLRSHPRNARFGGRVIIFERGPLALRPGGTSGS